MADRKPRLSMEQIKRNLVHRNLPAIQTEEMAQPHMSRAAPSIRNAQKPDTLHSEDSPSVQDTNSQPETLKVDPTNKLSHVRHFNMPDELHNDM